ncbi:aminoglycoside adenylyltransferase domain-containing protein [Kribbella turkmenica]|uniref:aminoglycoside adenylyltransferase domain-containing protein n=1 Tax=Kribbella turkmenica TaxID=2530375 RepID=UPI001405078B|nr:aminoglycoside adenylyltransferase domain-containing protein [Kribbella turkmenica]
MEAYVRDALDAIGLRTVGVYVHGSLAMDCFYRAKSDVDVLVVVPETLTGAEREHVARTLAERSEHRPMPGDLELSVLTVEQAANHQHPRPFEVHYSAAWTGSILDGRVDYAGTHRDPDLAAHITVTRERGATVSGPSPRDLFAPVPHDDYLVAITADLHDILSGEELLSAPYYGVLNACRVLATIKLGPGTVLSKEEGVPCARDNLPSQHHALIEQALTCYRSSEPVAPEQRATDGHDWDRAALLAFRDAIRARI